MVKMIMPSIKSDLDTNMSLLFHRLNLPNAWPLVHIILAPSPSEWCPRDEILNTKRKWGQIQLMCDLFYKIDKQRSNFAACLEHIKHHQVKKNLNEKRLKIFQLVWFEHLYHHQWWCRWDLLKARAARGCSYQKWCGGKHRYQGANLVVYRVYYWCHDWLWEELEVP